MDSMMIQAARLLIRHETAEVIRAAARRAMVPAGESPVCTGIGVVADSASGILCTNEEECAAATAASVPYVYACTATGASDMEAVRGAVAVLTATGGVTSHAAVLARSWRKPCVVGAGFSRTDGALTTHEGAVLRSGEWVTVCATTGSVWRGELARYYDPQALDVLRALTDAAKQLGELPGPAVQANAETGQEAAQCIALGADGVGVARTEHMFFGSAELPLLRRVLWPESPESRTAALESLRELLAAKCLDLMEACVGRRLTIRLLDPPAHEFADPGELSSGREENPMMGVRGARLGVLYPEIYHTQAQAILQAHLSLPPARRSHLALLLPFVTFGAEARALREILALPVDSGVRIGAMIESPEAVFRAPEIAAEVDFLSVGTNDLAQFCLAMSRDDVAALLLPAYLAHGLVEEDPVAHLNQSAATTGLLRLLAELVPGVPWGVCGEQAADPSSLRMILPLEPTYVSTSADGIVCARIEVGRHKAVRLLGGDPAC